MICYKAYRSAVCAVMCLLGVGTASAALIDRGGGLIYDSDLNITWLQDANYAMTSAYDADGRMNWSAANAWAADLSYRGYDDWRLPTARNQNGSDPCLGNYCTSSEMGYMFYNNFGANVGSVLSGTNTDNLALFTNLQSYLYWSGTVYEHPFIYAWSFGTGNGYQGQGSQSDEFYAWAVRPGDVTPIPEPQTYVLMLTGLGLFCFMARRGKQQRSA